MDTTPDEEVIALALLQETRLNDLLSTITCLTQPEIFEVGETSRKITTTFRIALGSFEEIYVTLQYGISVMRMGLTLHSISLILSLFPHTNTHQKNSLLPLLQLSSPLFLHHSLHPL